MTPQSKIRGHFAAFFTIFVWGITFISTKVLLVSFSAVEILFFRFVLATAALLAISPPRPSWGKPLSAVLRDEWKPAAAGLCGVTLYFLFQNLALTYTLAANASVLISSAPLFVALASRVFLREPLKPAFLLGFTAAMAGIALIAFNGSVVLKLNPLGDLLCLLAALSWAFYSVLVKKIGAPPGEVLALTRKVFLYGLLFLLPALALFEFRLGLERLADPANLLHLAFLGLGGSALCFVTWNYAVHALGPVTTSVYIYAVPLVTIAAAALVLREPVTLAAGAGMALILAGMAVSERGKKPLVNP